MKQANRINSIDIFRLIFSILVISIHTRPFEEINNHLSFFFVQVVPRIAVPFFFCVSGYYFIQKLNSGIACTQKTFLKVFKLYAFWTCIYYIRDLFRYIGNLNPMGIIHTFVIDFLLNGSSYHFWYFIGLLFSIAFVGLIYKLHLQKFIPHIAITLYIVGLLGCSYSTIGNQIPLFKTLINLPQFLFIRRVLLMAVPFFCLGGYINSIRKRVQVRSLITVAMIFFLFTLEIFFVTKFKIGTNVIITLLLPILLVSVYLWLINNPFETHTELAKNCRSLANYSFYVHPLIIWILYFIKPIQKLNTIVFLLTVLCCFLSWTLLKKVKHPIIQDYIV